MQEGVPAAAAASTPLVAHTPEFAKRSDSLRGVSRSPITKSRLQDGRRRATDDVMPRNNKRRGTSMPAVSASHVRDVISKFEKAPGNVADRSRRGRSPRTCTSQPRSSRDMQRSSTGGGTESWAALLDFPMLRVDHRDPIRRLGTTTRGQLHRVSTSATQLGCYIRALPNGLLRRLQGSVPMKSLTALTSATQLVLTLELIWIPLLNTQTVERLTDHKRHNPAHQVPDVLRWPSKLN